MFLALFSGSISTGIPHSGYAAQAEKVPDKGVAIDKAHKVGNISVLALPEAVGPPEGAASRTIPFLVPKSQGFAEAKKQAEQPGFVAPGNKEKKIVFPPETTLGPQIVSTDLSFKGVSGNRPNPCQCSPPDVAMAVGPNHVVEFVNLAGKIWNKDGTIAKKTFPLSSFFLLATNSMSDPYVIYDSIGSRWFASIVDIPNGRVQFAVSATTDPTGSWLIYFVSTSMSNILPDQPFIGASDDKFVISANDFTCCFTYTGVQFWVLNKAQLLAGAVTVDLVTNTPDPNLFSLHPAQHLSSTSAFYLVSNCLMDCVSSTSSQTNSLFIEVVTGVPCVSCVPPTTVTLTTFLLTGSIATSTNPPDAQQPGTTALLNTDDNRILSAVWRSGQLWFSFNDACTPGGVGTPTLSCARLISLTTFGISSAPTVGQDFDFSTPSKYVFYPAVSLDSSGNLVVVFGRSSASEFPSLYVTGRLATALPNTLQTPVLIFAGSKPDLSTRYGDYFSAATDPSTLAFWVAGEFRVFQTFQAWSTGIARVHIS